MNNYKTKFRWTRDTFLIRSRLPSGSIGALGIKDIKPAELTRIDNERKLYRYANIPPGCFKVTIEYKEIADGARYNVRAAERFCARCNNAMLNRFDSCKGSCRATTKKKEMNGTEADAQWLPNFRIVYICGEIIDLEGIMKRTPVPGNGRNRKYTLLTDTTDDMLANEANACDDKGHLIAASFGGPNCHFNLVPQPVVVNQSRAYLNRPTGCYYEVEDKIRKALKAVNPHSTIVRAFMRVDANYRDDGVIPDWFRVAVYRYDGSAATPLNKNILVRNEENGKVINEKDKGIGVANWR